MTELASEEPRQPLALASYINHPQLVAYGLQCGAHPNPATDDRSPLHIALENRTLFQYYLDTEGRHSKPEFTGHVALIPHPEKPAGFALQLINPGIKKVDYLAERKKAEFIAQQLLVFGAQLEHVPAQSNDPLAPIDDAGLWHDTCFAGDIVTVALYCALRRKEPLPRLRPHIAFQRAMTEHGGEEMGNAIVRQAMENMQKLRQRIAFKLQHPETPVERAVAQELPAEERAYWQGGSYRQWATRLAR